MASTKIQHEFDCSEATFWEVCFFDQEFSRRLYLEELRFPAWKVLEEQKTDNSMRRRVLVEPLIENIPPPIKKLMGDSFGYTEEGELDRVKGRYTFRVTPGSMADKSNISGVIYCESLGEKRVRRIVEFKVEIKVFMVGKLIEQKSIDDTTASYNRMAAFMKAYLVEKGLNR